MIIFIQTWNHEEGQQKTKEFHFEQLHWCFGECYAISLVAQEKAIFDSICSRLLSMLLLIYADHLCTLYITIAPDLNTWNLKAPRRTQFNQFFIEITFYWRIRLTFCELIFDVKQMWTRNSIKLYLNYDVKQFKLLFNIE